MVIYHDRANEVSVSPFNTDSYLDSISQARDNRRTSLWYTYLVVEVPADIILPVGFPSVF